MRNTDLTYSANLTLWQRKASRISFTPAGESDPIVIRLINPSRNAFYAILNDRFGMHGKYKTRQGIGFDTGIIDGWIKTFILQISVIELRQIDAEKGSPNTKELQDDPRYVPWRVCNPEEVAEVIA